MATSSFTELRHYPRLEEDTVVFTSIWGLVASGTSDPITNNPTSIHLDLVVEGRTRLALSLGSGLTWNPVTKQVSIEITNAQTSFIRDDGQIEYAFYVVWDYGQAQTIREGTVSAVRVA